MGAGLMFHYGSEFWMMFFFTIQSNLLQNCVICVKFCKPIQYCSNKPHNPLLNSGAIMSAGLLLAKLSPGLPVSTKFDLVGIF